MVISLTSVKMSTAPASFNLSAVPVRSSITRPRCLLSGSKQRPDLAFSYKPGVWISPLGLGGSQAPGPASRKAAVGGDSVGCELKGVDGSAGEI